MRCAACGEETAIATCGSCGGDARLGGRYQLDEVVGQGASGTVYRGTDVRSGGAVAIKEMAHRIGAEAKTRELVEREGRVLRQLDHPNIPRWIDEVIAGSGRARALFLVQEFIEGRSLADELPEHRWSEAEALELMAEVLPILDYLHSRHPPVIHRDLKPGNLLRRTSGSVALVDFGAVRDVLASERIGGSTVAGTFGYMAPEQFRGHAEPATDLYALGVSVVALLSRRDPAAMHDRAGRLCWEDAVAVSPAMHGLLARLLAPDPDARPASAAAVLRHVAALRAGERGAPERATRMAAPPGVGFGQPGEPSSRPAPMADPLLLGAPLAAAPFEPPARRAPRLPPQPGRALRLPPQPGRAPSAGARRTRHAVLLGGVLLVLLAGLVASLLVVRTSAPAPLPPTPRVMPVPEVRPVPGLRSNVFIPAADPTGESHCLVPGVQVGGDAEALPVSAGEDRLEHAPAIRFPSGVGQVGDEHACSLRFVVHPEGHPAEVAISAVGCPSVFQQTVCDVADDFRFEVPAGAEAAGGFTVETRVVFRKR